MNVKKIIISLLCIATLFTFVSCGKDTDNKNTNTNTSTNDSNTKSNSNTAENAKDNNEYEEKPATVPSQIPYNVQVLPPNSIGTIYGNLTYTNNGSYPVTMFKLTIQYTRNGKEGEKTYFTSYDTVLPSETSPVMKTFCNSDWKPLTLEYKIYDKDTGKYRSLKYDYKLDELRGSKWIQK